MSFHKTSYKNRLELAKQIARESGDLTLRYFYDSEHVTVERKTDESPVTIADREAEKLLRKRIEESFPDDAILGEEFPNREGTSGFRWILDPIDGTKSFIHGVPIYSTLIGLEQNGVNFGGVISAPALGELVWAGRGLGAWHEAARFKQPVPAKVSDCRKIDEALFLTSEVLTFDQSDRQDSYKRLERSVRLSRTWGDAYGYFLVATGRAEIMVDPILSDWDAGPLLVILEEAGGRFTDWKGNATMFGKEGVGTNGFLHDNVLRILNET
ncbi:MAG: histidinol-phosphatase [Planctomycetaceae bacterium]|jgi:histidinol phosphatase-like enzyme (inositol monophosphatase family)|nr:histidinol-phosphatase [Planctomycetaceae bacterium]